MDVSPAAAHAAIRDGIALEEVAGDLTEEGVENVVGECVENEVGESVDGNLVPSTVNDQRPEYPDAYDVLGPVGGSETTVRRLVAAAARTRGETTPHDGEIRDLEAELSSIEVPEPEREVDAAKRSVVEASRNETELRERIAALRGQLQTERELGEPTEETIEQLEAAAAELSESATDRIAAEQALEAATREARKARSVRNRRMKLQDRLENRRRQARAHLANALWGEFRRARTRVRPLVEMDTEEGSSCEQCADERNSVARSSIVGTGRSSAGAASQLAAVALADLEVPIVIDASQTGIVDADRASRSLGAAVWLCE